MTFEEMLDQALAMLQRRGRVSYRALQRQFALDEDALTISKTSCFTPTRRSTTMRDVASSGVVMPALRPRPLRHRRAPWTMPR